MVNIKQTTPKSTHKQTLAQKQSSTATQALREKGNTEHLQGKAQLTVARVFILRSETIGTGSFCGALSAERFRVAIAPPPQLASGPFLPPPSTLPAQTN